MLCGAVFECADYIVGNQFAALLAGMALVQIEGSHVVEKSLKDLDLDATIPPAGQFLQNLVAAFYSLISDCLLMGNRLRQDYLSVDAAADLAQ
jgi:hypothetical protein